jgi:hypothetical protein
MRDVGMDNKISIRKMTNGIIKNTFRKEHAQKRSLTTQAS